MTFAGGDAAAMAAKACRALPRAYSPECAWPDALQLPKIRFHWHEKYIHAWQEPIVNVAGVHKLCKV